MTPPGLLAVTKNLIALERGPEELLLANSFHMRPLYVARGKERVRRVLSGMATPLPLDDLTSACAGDADLIQLLRDYRILVDAAAEKERYDPCEIAATAAGPRRRDRMTVYLLLTESCNLGCIYCLNGAGTYQRNSRSMMSPETALRSVTACLEQLDAGGHLEVAFFGGEPLLNWPLAKEVIRLCENELASTHGDKKISYHITSNLTLCPADLVEQIKRHRITVMCDIDGPAAIHDRCRPDRRGAPTHARTVTTIRRLVDAGIPVALRATLTAVNQDHIVDIATHHKELGASNSAFVPVCPINSDRTFLPDELLPDPDTLIAGLAEVYRSGLWDTQHLFPFNQYLLKLRPGARQVTACAAPSGTTPVVRVNGDVYLCIYLVGQERYRFGTLGTAWDRRPLTEALAALHVDNDAACRACPWRYACGGGCPVMKLVPMAGLEQNPRAMEYGRRINCDFTRAVLAELFWDMADQARTSAAGGRRPAAQSPPEPARIC